MEIQRHPEDLRKPLKVHFVGEEGVDEGGVQKEFFQLLIRQVFDPAFGMFSYNDETRLFWFGASSMLGLEMEYELIGMIVGLAIYNGHILEFRFPMLIYRKLMGQPPGMRDLKEVNPWVHSGFLKMLDATPAEVDAYGLVFQASQEVFGEVQTVDLAVGGEGRPVTAANRREYVDLYVEWYLTSSIQSQFGAFHRGFNRLCGGPVVPLNPKP
jgi:ubiquitin-protein ligase E3 A